jgi:hypothetical protein
MEAVWDDLRISRQVLRFIIRSIALFIDNKIRLSLVIAEREIE